MLRAYFRFDPRIMLSGKVGGYRVHGVVDCGPFVEFQRDCSGVGVVTSRGTRCLAIPVARDLKRGTIQNPLKLLMEYRHAKSNNDD